jgi:hypothetical protein
MGSEEILVSGGKVVTANGAQEVHTDNSGVLVLDIERLRWRRQGAGGS